MHTQPAPTGEVATGEVAQGEVGWRHPLDPIASTDSDQSPYPWLIRLPRCGSTNTWALAHADALAHGACVWTERQESGRGRGGRVWLSPPGVLTATFLLRLPGALAARQLGLATGLAIAHAVEDLVPDARVMIKWPNDCQLDGRKLAGVLCERSTDDEAVAVGIGLNLDPRWDLVPEALPTVAVGAASLAEACVPGTAAPSALTVLPALRRYLLEACGLIQVGGWGQFLPALRARDSLQGRRVRIDHGGSSTAGVADGIDGEGRLELVNDSGRVTCAGGTVAIAG